MRLVVAGALHSRESKSDGATTVFMRNDLIESLGLFAHDMYV